MTTSTITTMLIETVGPADQERAIAALTLAFSADPACRWAWPEPRQYLASFPNNPLYERHGFEVIGRMQSGSSPVITPMLRPAR